MGAALLYVIASIVLIGSLATGIAYFDSSSTTSEISQSRSSQAYYASMSGLKAWRKIQQSANPSTYTLGDSTFTLSYTGSGLGPFAVTSVGAAAGDAHFASQKTYPAEEPEEGFSDFGPEIENQDEAITNFSPEATRPDGYTAAQWQALLNKYGGESWIRFANSLTNTNGAIWYRGDRGFCPGGNCPVGACSDGKCALGNGLRVVFSFVFNDKDASTNSSTAADVMAFCIMNAGNNDPDTAAGGAASGESYGEYLGYAGLGVHSVGIRPPKIGVEVDTYPNTTRNDDGDNNHIAALFWGQRDDAGYRDDNYHGAGGSSNNPENPEYESSAKIKNKDVGYAKGSLGNGYNRYNWLEDGATHTIRIEVLRNTSTRKYEIKVWVVDGRPSAAAAFMDVTVNYSGSSPLVDYLMPTAFSTSDNTSLGHVYFGFTEATGDASQTADLYGLRFEFIQ
jgi:hypothetical protein